MDPRLSCVLRGFATREQNTKRALALSPRPPHHVYYGRQDEITPEDATHVRVDSSVRAIVERAFYERREFLVTGILKDGLEEIEEYACNGCWSLKQIVVLNAVKTMKDNFDSRRWAGGDWGGGI